MTDTEFLDSLEFRANCRTRDNALIKLTAEENNRLHRIQHLWPTRISWIGDKGLLLGHIHSARDQIARNVAAKLTGRL